ncbi:MAG: enoyl-CoA hydratase/isomerase family protein [Gemmatimonadaceae bacterium]|nr:enoyl-CoA hydratase/isomerase family protein [Gemmatimonadaceae bacterium]
MTESGKVRSTIADGIATITFSHPKGNSLPGALLKALAAAVSDAGKDPSARVIVLRSDGEGAFCAGASFTELQGISNEAQGLEFFSGFANLILAMIRAPKFIVTRVQGKTVGGGVGIVAASDYAIGARSASVRLSELAVGIGPFVVGPVIEKKIGLAAFSALAVDADWRDAEWAERHGLFAAVANDAAQLDRDIAARTTVLSASSPEAMSRLKQAFWAGTESWDDLLRTRAAASGTLVLSDFAKSAIHSSPSGRG